VVSVKLTKLATSPIPFRPLFRSEGSWGRWAIEVKTGRYDAASLRGLLDFTRRHPKFTPLIVCEKAGLSSADRVGVQAIEWSKFLLSGPPTGKR